MPEIVTQDELESLGDGELVELIMDRSNLDVDAAREALAIIRDDVPDGEIV